MNTDQPERQAMDLLKNLVETPSPTGKEGELAAVIRKSMLQAGFDQVHVDQNHNVISTMEGHRKGKKVLFLTHSDTGAQWESGKERIAEVVPGERFGKSGPCLTGPGAAAPKASIAAMILAGKALAARKKDFAGRMQVAVVTKDLLANHDGPREVSNWIKDADFAITAEPSDNSIVTAARGILQVEITLNGTPEHWGTPEPTRNLLYRMADFLNLLRQEPTKEDPIFGRTGFNPINAHVTAVAPRTPQEVRIIIDRRLLPGEDSAVYVDRLSRLISEGKVDNSGRVKIFRRMYPFQAEGSEKELGILSQTVRETIGFIPQSAAVKFATNAAFLIKELGMRALVLGPGNINDLGPEEHVEVKSVLQASEIYKNFVLRYGAV